MKQAGKVSHGKLLLDSLIASYEREDFEVLESEDTHLQQTKSRKLANRLASTFAGFSYTADDKKEVFQLVQNGVSYMLKEPRTRCYFSECALVPFTSKLVPQDAQKVLSKLQDVEGEISPQSAAEVVAEYSELLAERARAKPDKAFEKKLEEVEHTFNCDSQKKGSREAEEDNVDEEEEEDPEENEDEQEEEEEEDEAIEEDEANEDDEKETLATEEPVGRVNKRREPNEAPLKVQ